jgi:serine/threonine-protein kinase RIO1
MSQSTPDGKSLLERDINGKVRFFGPNLKATSDFAKKAAHVTHEIFSSTESKS